MLDGNGTAASRLVGDLGGDAASPWLATAPSWNGA